MAAIVGSVAAQALPGNIVSAGVWVGVSYPTRVPFLECQSRGFAALCVHLGDGRQQVVINSVQNNRLAAPAGERSREKQKGEGMGGGEGREAMQG